ncbi:PREDICTED: protein Wiz [Elephantulus edwardii]|uniref:protein Wiz n=1 Tax=Elephantulus edwardii TaxID=28737 RepID=UPI0003F0A037|nr:PREDICTED: protein Wiz [Elephantulus edwardii]
MDGVLAGGLAAPDRPRGPERLPGPAPREDIEGGTEAAEGEGGIFRSTRYLPVTKEGPQDILDGRGGISGSPPPHFLGHFPGPHDGQGPWEHPLVQEGIPSERRFEDSVIVRTVKPHAELEGAKRLLHHHQGGPKLAGKEPRGLAGLPWLEDVEEQAFPQDVGLHLDSFRRVLVPTDDNPQTMTVTVTQEDPEALTPPPEWSLPRAALEVATQTWTVNSEASVERLQPLLPPVQTGPYLCELLEEVAEGTVSPDEDEEEDEEPAVFPCIECSIYFRQKEHLLEHMSQHRRTPGQEPPAELAPLACGECGWAFADPGTLEQHQQLHQSSREKIIEEIQKLKQVPEDEGRQARLQCSKCVFGTNSSKAFGQHTKLHAREHRGPVASEPFGSTGGSSAGSPGPETPNLAFQPYASSPGLSACIFCGFPAPSESLLREHVRFVHARPHWDDGEAFQEDPAGQPGTSQDAYAHFPDATEDSFGKAEPLVASSWQASPAGYNSSLAFEAACQPLGEQEFPLSKSPPCGAPQRPLGKPPYSSPPAPAPYSVQPGRNKSSVHLLHLQELGDTLGCEFPGQLGDQRHPWSGEEDDMILTSEIDLTPENGVYAPPVAPLIPQTALELKRAFQGALWAAEGSQAQQQQLRKMVPVVVMAKLTPEVMAAARVPPRLQVEELELRGNHPLDFLLLDAPLDDPLGLDTLLDGDPAALKHEERKCPYCPDRFHNGIGLANHVRGHLNRVGVSYNVRHFISAEEVKAIERRFSFQKKKKKVANFDPGTFSLMRCDFCGAGFDTRAGLSSHARAHLRDFGITNWEVTVSPINILQELLATSAAEQPPSPLDREAGGPPGAFLTSRRPRLPLTVPFPPTWAEDTGSVYGDAQSLTTCEVCGACFETRKGLSSHARSHLRQLGVAESESSGAPIDLLYELVKQKGLPDMPLGLPPGLTKKSSSPKEVVTGVPRPGLLALAKPLDAPAVNKAIKSPPGFLAKSLSHSPSSPLLKKTPLTLAGSPALKNPEDKSPQLSLSPRPASPKAQWPQSEDEGPLNLTSGPEPTRDIRCEFCGEFFENRKGLSSHARSHLRQMGVTEWYVNGSPIDTLREILKRQQAHSRPGGPLNPPGPSPKTLAKIVGGPGSSLEGRSPADLLSPLAKKLPAAPGSPLGHSPTASPAPTARKMFAGLAAPSLSKKLKPEQMRVEIKREMLPGALHGESHLSEGPWVASREDLTPLNLSSRAEPTRDIRCEFCGEFFENRKGLSLPAEVKAKTYIQTELPFKTKTIHEKTSHSSTEACCELCGLYFENRKALASHARAHLRQFGVTEWCVNGSPIETLSEWIKHRPQKVGAYRSYIQGGRPFTKKFRSAGHGRDGDKRLAFGLMPGGLAMVGRSVGGELGPEAGRAADSGERPLVASPPGTVKAEEYQRQNINKFERRQARPPDAASARGGEEMSDLQQKLEEARQPPPRVRPVPSLVPRPPQTSLVKFVGNIYTLKCRFCELEFQGPLSIQEEWVRHLQRHILEMNFSKADPPPEEPQAPPAQTAAAEAP